VQDLSWITTGSFRRVLLVGDVQGSPQRATPLTPVHGEVTANFIRGEYRCSRERFFGASCRRS
jgi:hypothetical protein